MIVLAKKKHSKYKAGVKPLKSRSASQYLGVKHGCSTLSSLTQCDFKFIDLFAGIGGFRIGLEKLGGCCVASSEIDRDAIAIYRENWPKDPPSHNLGNICDIKDFKQVDLVVGGVPCQSWSIAGKNKGVQDSRGRLWYEAIRLVEKWEPKAFMFENVKGLTDPRHRESLNFLLKSFSELGYRVEYKLLNSYDFGIPQNRDRVFIVGIKEKLIRTPLKWPTPRLGHTYLSQIVKGVEKSTKATKEVVQRNPFGERINVGFNKLTPKGVRNSFFYLTDIRNGPTSVHSWDLKDVSQREKQICMVMLKNRRKSIYGPCDGNPMSFLNIKKLIPDVRLEELEKLDKKKILRKHAGGKYDFYNRRLSGGIDGVYRVYMPSSTFFSTLTASGTKDVVSLIEVSGETDWEYRDNFIKDVLKPKKYRALTPSEMAKLQGFPQGYKLHGKKVKNIKLFGNSVSVPVIAAVGASIISTGCFKIKRSSYP